jgi:hypothetical protein
MGALANGIVGNAVGNAVVAGLTGGDPVAAMVNSGVGGAIGAITGKIDGFSELPPSVQRVFNATLRAELSGKDPSKAAILAATTAGLQAIKNGMDANAKFQKNYGREATAEELNNFAHVSTQEELNSSFDKYMTDITAKSQAEAQAKIDEANEARLTAWQKSQDDDAAAAAAQVEAERKAREAAEAEESARQATIAEQNRVDEAERLRQAGLEENKEVNLNKVVTGGDTTDEDAEQAKRVADFGKDLTGGGVQDLGPVDAKTGFYDEDSSGMGAYKHDPTSGTYTYTSDDGSTLTLDGEGTIVGVTESTDTPWTGITDTKTGNLKLPKLPSGKVPVIPATAVKPTKPPVTPPAEPDPLAAILGQQQTPVTYQTVTPELANVFYRNKDFSSTPQKINEEGQLVQSNPLLSGSDFLDLTKPQPASALAPQSNPRENDVAAMLAKILGGEGGSTSQEELLKILGKG